jgi:hypothetical protein
MFYKIEFKCNWAQNSFFSVCLILRLKIQVGFDVMDNYHKRDFGKGNEKRERGDF